MIARGGALAVRKVIAAKKGAGGELFPDAPPSETLKLLVSGTREGAMEPGEHAWVDAAVLRYQGPLQVYVQRLLGDADGARDVVQETFLRLCRQPRADVEPQLVAWLYAVCRNQVVDLRRRENRMTMAPSPVLELQTDESPAVVQKLEHAEASECARQLLAQLPAQQQEVVRLKFEHALSYREIGEVTGLSAGNVGYILHQALLRLRTRMAAGHA